MTSLGERNVYFLKVAARKWRLLVGLGLLAVLVFVVGPRELLAVLQRASPQLLAAVTALLFSWLILGGLNVWILLRCLGEVPVGLFLKAYAASWATSLLLPGQLGDATQVLLLKRQGVAMAVSGAAYLVDKVVSLGWMLVVAAAGISLYTSLPMIWLAGLVSIGCLGLLALFLVYRQLADVGWGRLDGLKVRLHRLLEQIQLFQQNLLILILNASLTVAKWIVLAWIYQLAFRTFGTEISWPHAATFPVLSSLVGYIPISVGGAGTMEWTAVGLFGAIGVEAKEVLGAYLLIRAILLTTAFVVLLTTQTRISPGKEKST